MIFGKNSDLKNHLSAKKPTWTHKVMVRSPHEQSSEMARKEESPSERDPPLRAERSESIESR
jgi:hypothetical protein